MSENTNPFSRRKTKLMTTDGNSIGTIAEVSSKDDDSDVENKAIEQFIPSQATVDEGVQRMINILNKQRLDDIRDGVQNPGPELSIPNVQKINQQGVDSNQNYMNMPSVTPEMLSTLNTKMYTDSVQYGNYSADKNIKSTPVGNTYRIDVFSPSTNNSNNDKIQFAVPHYKQDELSPSTVATGETNTKLDKKEDTKPKFTPKDVLPLLDSIITYGYASETFSIGGNKVTIRTQFFWEENAIRDAIEKYVTKDTMRVTAESLLQQYALASCLVSVGGNYFRPINSGTPEELRNSLMERVSFLNTLPSVLVYYINKRRGDFNDKVVYLSENFDEVLKSF